MNRQVLEAVSFPVEKRQVYFKGAQGYPNPIPGRQAVVRTDTEQALSIVSDEYKLVPYAEVVEPLLEAVDKQGGKLVERTYGRRASPVRIEGDGKRVWIEATFGGGIEIGKDLIQPRLVYGNSYDTTSAVRVICGFFQVKCTNAGALMIPGQVRGMGGGSFYAQHHGKWDLELAKIGDGIKLFLDGFENHAQSLRSMLNMRVPDQVMDQLSIGIIGQRALAKKPLTPQDQESAWAFYSRLTNYITMDFKGGQQPAERRAAAALKEIMEQMR